jgi:hypothetical protein
VNVTAKAFVQCRGGTWVTVFDLKQDAILPEGFQEFKYFMLINF